MAATWADIQRLVTDLQRVQLTQSAKKLSEANCVEVVTKLIQRSMIDVVFTRDGHSYITRNHLATEVRNECVASGGRAPLTDIAATLNVDLDHVENVARELVAENIGFTISGGELFSEEYVVNLQAELRSLLAEHGHQTMASLCKHWNLSNDLLRTLLLDHLSQDFDGVIDGDSLYTLEYLESHKNCPASITFCYHKAVADQRHTITCRTTDWPVLVCFRRACGGRRGEIRIGILLYLGAPVLIRCLSDSRFAHHSFYGRTHLLCHQTTVNILVSYPNICSVTGFNVDSDYPYHTVDVFTRFLVDCLVRALRPVALSSLKFTTTWSEHMYRMSFRQHEFIQTSVLKKLGISESAGARNGQVAQLLRQGNDDFKIEAATFSSDLNDSI
ncbi:hypothetical protein KIN20_014066 [Parelaphostrongylus tenuis]|uniref:E3 UFM1-protein ligase 1 homolog n=1 Tax=Parelaphostrongylus tenuis TaxID=148309 RepID=A0AAD5QP58_PARTN|nr:hypothetical protein KIN20_014066 [Parelaphostrongylus tenuis]